MVFDITCAHPSFTYLVTGPMCLGPLSEVFGRARVLQAANFWYLGESTHSLPSILPRVLIHVLSDSVELRVRICAEHGRNVGLPVSIRIRWQWVFVGESCISSMTSLIYPSDTGATLDWRGRPGRRVEARATRSSRRCVLPYAPPWSRCRPDLWCVDSAAGRL